MAEMRSIIHHSMLYATMVLILCKYYKIPFYEMDIEMFKWKQHKKQINHFQTNKYYVVAAIVIIGLALGQNQIEIPLLYYFIWRMRICRC